MTGGRTRSDIELPIETIVRTTEMGSAHLGSLTLERHTIAEMCSAPLSVAELSAHLGVPIGVARVLVGDMVNEGLLRSHEPQLTDNDRPDLQLLERVLDGLQAL